MSENVLERWLDEAAAALGVDAPDAQVRNEVLDVARDVAHNVARPGAPLTAFLLGVAVGRGADPQRMGEVLRGLATRSG
ncbi:DUF6457 domain-containing protein [Dactylosporangium sp. CA-139066]|uniref:DUF6457 domain-containing protein n=1 Tax=Dactylosporangium sp. CA-139066 TaxID=3239930 RepID=UPI003D913BFE